MSWDRMPSREGDSRPRVWEHQEKERTVKVEKYSEEETWDALRDDRLVENYDDKEEAIERAEKILEEFSAN